MLKKMSVILFGVILSCCISVFASTEEKESVGVVSDNNMVDGSVFLDRAANAPGMDRYDEKEMELAGEIKEAESENVSYDGVSEREENILDETVSANEVLERTDEMVSTNEVLEETDEAVSANEILEGTGEIVSANEILEETDEIISEDEIPDKKKPEKKPEKGEGTVSGSHIAEEDPENESKDETVVKVSFPEKLRISLDPKNLLGKGSIYSDEYKIVNYGNSDVVIRIKMTDVFYKSRGNAEENPNTKALDIEESPSVEDLNVKIAWENGKNVKKSVDASEGEDVYFLHLKASQYDEKNEFVKLGKGSEMSFRFTGDINGDSDVQWNVDALGLNVSYRIENAKSMENQEKVDAHSKNEEISENENDQYRLE